MAPTPSVSPPISGRNTDFEQPVDFKTAARFLGVSASLVYAYVERKQIPHFRMMGRAIRFRLSELQAWASSSTCLKLSITNDQSFGSGPAE